MKLETGIQTAIQVYLSLLENQGKVYFFRNNSFEGFFNRPNGSRGYIKNAKRGMPDIVCCVRSYIKLGSVSYPCGIFVALEVKTDKGKQSEYQKEAQKAIEKCGGKYYIVRSVEDVSKIMSELLVPKVSLNSEKPTSNDIFE